MYNYHNQPEDPNEKRADLILDIAFAVFVAVLLTVVVFALLP